MSHVTHEWVTSHMNEPCHIWMSHATYEWVMSHMNESPHIWMNHVTYEWVMTRMNESCHIWVQSVPEKNETQNGHRNGNRNPKLSSMSLSKRPIWKEILTFTSKDPNFHPDDHLARVSTFRKRAVPTISDWLFSFVDESCPAWMCHVTFEWVVSRMNESRHI